MNKLITLFFIIITTVLHSQQNMIWETINFPDSLTPKTINAQREGILLVSASGSSTGGLYRSYDYGQSWEELIYDSIWHSAPATIQYSLDNVLFIGTVSGIYRSYDDGSAFENVYSGYHGYLKYVFSPENYLYTVGWELSLRTKDMGNSWDTLCYHGPNGFYSDISFGSNNELYAVGGGYYPIIGGFFRSLDDGETWQNIGITNTFLRSVVVNSNGTIMAGGFDANKVYRSFDNGENWELSGNILADVMETYGNDLLIAGGNINSNHGCWFSEDWGNTWVDIDDNVLNDRIATISISPNNTIYIKSGTTPSTSQLFKSINPILINKKIEKRPLLNVFPNPCKSRIRILSNNETYFNEYILIDHLGRTVKTDNINDNTIDISNLKTGFYMLILISESENVKVKIEKI